ncbi:MAG: hypothetical protein H6557_17455 [Lewinellaceae bacterium]|nr:hypothetical protein [Phaeodactylibacter sp.]MCB9038404.1 hypothetical protein [Lewinellaceae bacterium]
MRNFLLLLLFFGLLLTACKKEDNPPQPEGPSYMGAATMLLNGEEVTFSPLLAYNYNSSTKVFLFITEFSPEGREGKSIAFTHLPLNKERHVLTRPSLHPQEEKSPGASLSGVDGDVLMYYYPLNEQDDIDDYIQFTHIDEETREVKGVFQASFYRDSLPNPDPSLPDSIVIAEGAFETVLQDR